MNKSQKSKSSTDDPIDESASKPRRSYGGRKFKPDADLKDSVIKVYLNEGEDLQLRRLHTEHTFFHGRLSLSDFIKRCCQLDGPVTKARIAAADTKLHGQLIQDVRKLASHLGAISTNYNQSVKRINSLPVSKKLIDEVEQFKPFHAELAEHTDELKKLIVRITEYSSKLK